VGEYRSGELGKSEVMKSSEVKFQTFQHITLSRTVLTKKEFFDKKNGQKMRILASFFTSLTSPSS